jgi:uncharacterized protein with HEPN domain
MKQPDYRKYLSDILAACDLLGDYTRGKSYEDYCEDSLLQSAVERQFEIVGEALNRALRTNPSLQDHISHASRIVAFRNRLIHAYAEISAELVWSVLKSNLPKLKDEVAALLRDSDAAGLSGRR